MKIEDLVKNALIEDIHSGDITTDYLDINNYTTAQLIAKDDGILAGINIAKLAFKTIDINTEFIIHKYDGDKICKGDKLADIKGKSNSLLKAERVGLNFLQRMSGIATMTNKYVEAIKPHKAKLLDTRKTTPLLRDLEKYAVRMGGGYNHRFGLYDMIMLKENHIRAAGSIREAIKAVKKHNTTYKIEVEVTNLQELEEAFNEQIDRVMLDNMSIEEMQEAVRKYSGKIELEASGNVTLLTIGKIAQTGVDFISSGALTHSYKSMDITLLFKE